MTFQVKRPRCHLDTHLEVHETFIQVSAAQLGFLRASPCVSFSWVFSVL